MDAALGQLAERYWDLLLERNPISATLLGDRRFDEQLEDLDPDADAGFVAAITGVQEEAAAIAPASLVEQDQLTRTLLLAECADRVTEVELAAVEWSCDALEGAHASLLTHLPQISVSGTEQVGALARRLGEAPRFLGQALERLRSGVSAGRPPAAVNVARALRQLDGYLGGPLAEDPLVAVVPDELDAEPVEAAVRDHLRPALMSYRDGIVEHVQPAARPHDRSGLCWTPRGGQDYLRLVQLHTGLDLDPQWLHDSGDAEIRGPLGDELRGMAGALLGGEDLDTLVARLRDDGALRFRDAAELRKTAEEALERAGGAMNGWFGRLPTLACEVREMPAYLAADAPPAYYMRPASDGSRPGVFWVNAHAPEEQFRFEAEAVAFHEGIPGHHLERALAQELEGVPEFRRQTALTAYVEGWGLYAERLADEMGLYSSDLDRVGMVVADTWRAARLVVDTGLHALGWTRQQAIDYLVGTTARPPADLVSEVDRYLAMPGQALAYKVGQRELLECRRDASARLGPAFDIAAFHDAVLGAGPVSLPLLRDMVDGWVVAQQDVRP